MCLDVKFHPIFFLELLLNLLRSPTRNEYFLHQLQANLSHPLRLEHLTLIAVDEFFHHFLWLYLLQFLIHLKIYPPNLFFYFYYLETNYFLNSIYYFSLNYIEYLKILLDHIKGYGQLLY